MEIQSDVVSKKLDDQEVLLQLKSGTYYGLNASGTLLFELLKKGGNKKSLIDGLMAHFTVAEEQAAQDVEEFLQDLLKHGLICGDS